MTGKLFCHHAAAANHDVRWITSGKTGGSRATYDKELLLNHHSLVFNTTSGQTSTEFNTLREREGKTEQGRPVPDRSCELD